jgi:chromosome segregation protein
LKERGNIYLKKLILENFLSFQRDEVDFSGTGKSELPRLILIIGPNWSGKTSIFQAIKFALGSNERDDRYKKWSDFIRNGQNHAMVEAHIQHNNELIKIRRIVLRGKAPYYEIQRKNHEKFSKIHANEIQKLIENLQINPDNHFAFVSQGKIDAIKSLKPLELCNFLEEGIGLKTLREEILQQKDNVYSFKRDFESLITKKSTLNFNLEFLKPKLVRLTEKQNLLKQKQVYEDELLWANKEKLKTEIEFLEGQVKKAEEIIHQLTEDINQNLRQIEDIDTEISIIEEDINKITLDKGGLTFQKKDYLSQIQEWQNEKIIMKRELDQCSETIAKAEKEYKNLENQKKKIELEIDTARKEKQLLRQKIDNLIDEQNKLTKKVKENREFLETYNEVLTQKETLKRKIVENNEIVNNTEKDINDIFQSLEDMNHKLENNKWFLDNPTKDLMKQFDKDLSDSTLKLFDIKVELEQLNYEKTKKINKLKELQNALRERKIIIPANINILKEEIVRRGLNEKVKGPIIDYLSYNDDLSYAIESVLGERLLHSFIAMDWDTLNLFRKLKNKYNAYCNIYLPKNVHLSSYAEIKADGVIGYLVHLIKILNNDLDIQKVIYSKVKNCVVVKDYLSGRSLYTSHNFNGKCVTLMGEQIISYKYVYESPYIKRLKGLLSAGTQKEQAEILEREIEALNDKLVELRTNQSKLDEIQRSIYKKKEIFNDLLYNFTQKQRLTDKKNQLYDLIYSVEESNSNIKQKIDEINNEIKELEKQKEPNFFEWNDRLKEIPGEFFAKNNEISKWDLKLSERNQVNQELNEKLLASSNALKIIKNEFKVKEENFKKSDKKAFEIYKNLEVVEEKLEKIESNLTKLKENKLALKSEKNRLNNYDLQLKLSLEQETINHSSLNHNLREKIEDLKRIETNIGNLTDDISIFIRPIEDIEKDIGTINKKLLKFYDVDESILIEKEQILKSLKQITRNQKKLETDISAALKTEDKLEETYYNRFKLALEDLNLKINKRFENANIKAYCLLNLMGNFEDLGIEIKAATSKDQLKTCTALSGGQISMISINLILSLQEIKPSPLCMVDEAGMFLDEKNAEASYQMIKSTLDRNAIQLLMFLPKSSNVLYKLADKLIGVARVGKNEASTIFIPKIVSK